MWQVYDPTTTQYARHEGQRWQHTPEAEHATKFEKLHEALDAAKAYMLETGAKQAVVQDEQGFLPTNTSEEDKSVKGEPTLQDTASPETQVATSNETKEVKDAKNVLEKDPQAKHEVDQAAADQENKANSTGDHKVHFADSIKQNKSK